MNKKNYFNDNGEFKLTREMIESIPTLSSISFSSYAINKEGKENILFYIFF